MSNTYMDVDAKERSMGGGEAKEDRKGGIELVQTLDAHADVAWQLAWSSDGRKLLSCSADRTVKVWQLEDEGRLCHIATLEEHQKAVRSVCWHPDNKSFATASFDREIGIFTYEEGEFVKVTALDEHEKEVKSVSFHSSGTMLAHCGRDKAVWVREVDPDHETLGGEFGWDSLTIQHHNEDVKSVTWHPCEEILVSTSYDNSVKVWTTDDGAEEFYEQATLTDHKSTVWKAAFDPKSNGESTRFVTCSADKTIRIWRRQDQKWESVCTVLALHEDPIYWVDWSDDGLIATAGGDNQVVILKEFGHDTFAECARLRAPRTVRENPTGVGGAHEVDVNCVAFRPNPTGGKSRVDAGGILVATCGDDGKVRLWKLPRSLLD